MAVRPDIRDLKAFREWLAQNNTYSDIDTSLHCPLVETTKVPADCIPSRSHEERRAAMMHVFEAIEEMLIENDTSDNT